jgi:YD repeat-containing protein
MGIKTNFDHNEYGNVIETTLPVLDIVSSIKYDAASRPLSITDPLGRTSHTTYNRNDQVTEEEDVMGHTTQYDYDPNGNLTTITNAEGGVTTLTYDDATDQLTSMAFAGSTKQYSYNKDGSLNTFTKPDGTRLNYSYDALGRITSDGVNSYS